jgi:hypothetical protein
MAEFQPGNQDEEGEDTKSVEPPEGLVSEDVSFERGEGLSERKPDP